MNRPLRTLFQSANQRAPRKHFTVSAVRLRPPQQGSVAPPCVYPFCRFIRASRLYATDTPNPNTNSPHGTTCFQHGARACVSFHGFPVDGDPGHFHRLPHDLQQDTAPHGGKGKPATVFRQKPDKLRARMTPLPAGFGPPHSQATKQGTHAITRPLPGSLCIYSQITGHFKSITFRAIDRPAPAARTIYSPLARSVPSTVRVNSPAA